MSYRPHPFTACCPGEVNRIMPNFAARMWLAAGQDAIAAAFYGPSQVSAKLGKSRQQVTIVERTAYPFSERIEFEICTTKPINFALSLRIPGWCRKAQVLINGQPLRAEVKPASFIKIRRTFRHNDRISLILPMELKLSHWPSGGIGLERGPLVYALRIEEDWQIDKKDPHSNKEFPAWNLYAASPWNYALAVNGKNLKNNVEIVHRPFSLDPWSIDSAPIELHVPARRVRNWKIVKKKEIFTDIQPGKNKKRRGKFAFTPPLPDLKTIAKRLGKKLETVRLWRRKVKFFSSLRIDQVVPWNEQTTENPEHY